MATQKTQTTFLSQYNDDFVDSDHYHRILFNNGRALQARELTQSQTIIQNELKKVAGFIFKEGSLFNTSYGSISSGFTALSFVKVATLPVGYAQLVGEEVSTTSGIAAVVKAVIPAVGADADTLIVKYITSNNTSSSSTALSPKIFEPSNQLSYNNGSGFSGTLTVQTTNTASNPATGKCSFVEIPQFDTFVAGHIVMSESQSLIVSKYSDTPTETIGFILSEEIVSATDDIALYDNSGSTPNVTSPGADRYSITLTLALESSATASQTFYPIMNIVNGRVVNTQSQDTTLSKVGEILNTRTYSITGNFVERDNSNGEFKLIVEEDSDKDYLLYNLEGGVGWVGGQRTEKSRNTLLRVEKPRSLTRDITTKSNEFLNAEYGSYFVTNQSLKGLIGNISTLGEINLYNKTDIASSATVLGTTRVRHIDEVGNSFRVHVFDTKMDSSGGTAYSLGSVRSIGTDSENYANLRRINRAYDLYYKNESNLLFELPRTRVNNVSNVTMSVAKIYTDTTDGSGEATFSTGSSNLFTDAEQWIVTVNSTGAKFSPPTTSGSINTSATVTGLPTGSAVKLLGFETISAVRKTKTLVTGQTQSRSLSGRRFELTYHDIFKFTSVVDNTSGLDITEDFIYDNGHRDDYYSVGRGTLKSGVSAPAGTVTVTFDYFTHSAGDYFAGKASYPDIEYEDIPSYRLNNFREVRLSDVIDMRPKSNTGDDNFTGTGAYIEPLPKPGGLITIGEVDYWQDRVDVISLDTEGQLINYTGKTNLNAEDPTDVPDNDMRLHRITLHGYTLDNKDIELEPYSNLGYQMRDIEDLESRIENLENFASLNRAEIMSLKQTIPDPNDNTLPDRVKLGITADGFKDNNQSDIFNLDHRTSMYRDPGLIGPYTFQRTVELVYDSATSTNTVSKNGVVWPKYTESVMINQNIASKAIDLNTFDVAKSIGSGKIKPTTDTWTEQKKVNNKYKAQSSESYLGNIGNAISILSQGQNRG